MRIEVERIKNEPIVFTEEIEASTWDLDSFDVKFVKKIYLRCTFVRAGKEIFVKGNVETHRIIMCSRCLGNAEQDINQEFTLSYDVSRLGDYLEVDNDIREEILLDFPMKVLCKPDCKGICPGCGVNLNFEECKCKRKDK